MFSKRMYANVTCNTDLPFLIPLGLKCTTSTFFSYWPLLFCWYFVLHHPQPNRILSLQGEGCHKKLKIQIAACFAFLRKPTHGTCDLISIFTMSLMPANMKQCLYFLVIPLQHLCNETKFKLWLSCQIKKKACVAKIQLQTRIIL